MNVEDYFKEQKGITIEAAFSSGTRYTSMDVYWFTKSYHLTEESQKQEDIRNKLTPIKNLIAMIENGLAKGNIEVHDLVLKELEACKQSLEHLSENK